jgi:hypothetical protein
MRDGLFGEQRRLNTSCHMRDGLFGGEIRNTHFMTMTGLSIAVGSMLATATQTSLYQLIDWEVWAPKACQDESPGRLRWVTKYGTGAIILGSQSMSKMRC